jgi:hypothetical protein
MELYYKIFRSKNGEDSYCSILDDDAVLSGRLAPIRLEQGISSSDSMASEWSMNN